ncbi:hypothetical protein DH2020_035094 [Rehmannia glutinosa]|uniref:Reverse transcriptase domain-containing protein n=1 Tax=Rehmannia glutinosa TaxID=99300 RepID=A0ABR0V7L4_REHGL
MEEVLIAAHEKRDNGHTTEDCFTLKREIERLIQKRYLKDYVDQNRLRCDLRPRKDEPSWAQRSPDPRKDGRRDTHVAEIIDVISG